MIIQVGDDGQRERERKGGVLGRRGCVNGRLATGARQVTHTQQCERGEDDGRRGGFFPRVQARMQWGVRAAAMFVKGEAAVREAQPGSGAFGWEMQGNEGKEGRGEQKEGSVGKSRGAVCM